MCIQCERETEEMFCSIECACYSGYLNIKEGWVMEKFIKGFEDAIKTMDIPSERKKGTPINARWFLRNGGIRNLSHENFEQAVFHAKKLM